VTQFPRRFEGILADVDRDATFRPRGGVVLDRQRNHLEIIVTALGLSLDWVSSKELVAARRWARITAGERSPLLDPPPANSGAIGPLAKFDAFLVCGDGANLEEFTERTDQLEMGSRRLKSRAALPQRRILNRFSPHFGARNSARPTSDSQLRRRHGLDDPQSKLLNASRIWGGMKIRWTEAGSVTGAPLSSFDVA
jgi:hypothetical protein